MAIRLAVQVWTAAGGPPTAGGRAPSARIGPSFEEAIELLARARPARIVVVPYFLFAGRLIERLGDQVEAFRARYPWLKTRLAPHLGPDQRLFSLIDERLREALDGHRSLPCDNGSNVTVTAAEF
ncbi:MAG: hypothetical protein LC775_10875 [Acidobacteria bacterium]|nr:hypothetical protein [Acidobacteriota bacterium]